MFKEYFLKVLSENNARHVFSMRMTEMDGRVERIDEQRGRSYFRRSNKSVEHDCLLRDSLLEVKKIKI